MADEVKQEEIVQPQVEQKQPETPTTVVPDVISDTSKKVVDEIKIDTSKNYTPDEMKKFIAEAAKKGATISKNQLHDEIEKLKAKNLALENSAKEKNEKKSKTDEKEITAPVTDPLVAQQLKVMEDSFLASMSEIEALKAENKKKDLNLHIQKLIADSQGRIVPEMVKGESIEEIDESAKVAKAKFVQIENDIRSKLNIPAEPTPEEKKKAEEQNKPIEVPKFGSVRNPIPTRNELEDYKKQRALLLTKAYAEAGLQI